MGKRAPRILIPGSFPSRPLSGDPMVRGKHITKAGVPKDPGHRCYSSSR